MAVVFDTTMLLPLLDPKLPPPIDPATSAPVTDYQARLSFLVADLQRRQEKIIIPTPALAELLVRTGSAGPGYLTTISRSAAFRIEPFCERAAIEHAMMTAAAVAAGDKKAGSTESAVKVKFDRQIVAIARVHNAARIYSDDEKLGKFALAHGILVTPCWSLPLPPQSAQTSFQFAPSQPAASGPPPSPASTTAGAMTAASPPPSAPEPSSNSQLPAKSDDAT